MVGASGDGADDDDLITILEAIRADEFFDRFADQRFGFAMGERNDDGINAPVEAERFCDLFVRADSEDR